MAGHGLKRTRVLLGILALIALGPIGPSRAATTPTERIVGDLPMSDGVTLRYTVVKPVGQQRLPTLLEYSGYDPGTNPDATYIRRFVESGAGYSYIGVSLRGTGCSTGTFDFFQPSEATDAAAVIAWIIRQPWNNGRVGMIGKSYPGITQLFAAQANPPGLMAIAPGHFFNDAYRDVARPGGIQNYGFASLWSFLGQPSYEVQSGTEAALGGDVQCLNGTTAPFRGLPTNPFVQLQQHRFDDALFRERSPQLHLDRIRVPVLATLSWQDEQLASRGTDLLAQLDDLNAIRRARGQRETPWWATLTNGDHGMARTETEYADLRRFFDFHLKGIRNGWERRPRVLVWWDATVGERAPSWVTGLDHWSERRRIATRRLRPTALYLRADGGLTAATPAADEPSSQYVYTPVVGSQGIGNPAYGGVSTDTPFGEFPPDRYLWDLAPAPGTSAQWTTAALPDDLTLLGSASLDVWLSSTAPDTDLQVTLTEVRPDGQEMYLQKGWLKASQRHLDPARSTALRPYQTHQEADAELLQPGTPVLARVEIFPFGALLRRGSRLRVYLESPTVLPELWAFTPSPFPAVNTVLHDPEHASRLVLPVVPNDPNRKRALPACGGLIRQPCRASR